MRLLLLLSTLACAFPSVWSHTYLVNPQPRNQPAYKGTPVTAGDVVKYPYDGSGKFKSFNTIGWCGTPSLSQTAAAVPASAVVSNFPAPPVTTTNTYTAGSTIQVFWYHALAHPDPNVGTVALPKFTYGIRVAVNYSATDMQVLNVHTGPAAQSSNGILNGHIEQGTGYDPQANAMGWVPNATFVLPQGKTCTNCVLQFWLDSGSDNGGYVDCADISISAAAVAVAPTTTGPTTGTVTTAPTSAPPSTGIATNAPATTTSPTTPYTPSQYSSSTRVHSNVILLAISAVITWLWI